ncbi:MAG: damage-inducible protein DinB [Hyphomicrobiales bacterium]|nr:MAG: damage-inducible protein DinB [Hyphomicrobiales bacterium]
MKKFFLMQAQYNAWANGIIYEASAELSEEEYHRDIGAYFRSVHGTLNHMYAADMVWLARFSNEGEILTSVDDILFEDLADLREARVVLDERILSLVQQMTDVDFERPILFRTTRRPVLVEKPLLAAMAHFFTHHAHHRGQIHAFLRQLGYKPAPIDMIHFQEDIGVGVAAA